ncbi:TPA: Lar family restriction alleviation protein [Salmonella enterica subsp. enterica serovar Eastbourne]
MKNISPETLIVTKTSQETLIMKNNINNQQGMASVNAETASRISIVSSNTPLKPCPFCGALEVHLIEVKHFSDGEGSYYVACSRCNANQFPDSKDRAIHDWNQREKPDTDTEQAGAA